MAARKRKYAREGNQEAGIKWYKIRKWIKIPSNRQRCFMNEIEFITKELKIEMKYNGNPIYIKKLKKELRILKRGGNYDEIYVDVLTNNPGRQKWYKRQKLEYCHYFKKYALAQKEVIKILKEFRVGKKIIKEAKAKYRLLKKGLFYRDENAFFYDMGQANHFGKHHIQHYFGQYFDKAFNVYDLKHVTGITEHHIKKEVYTGRGGTGGYQDYEYYFDNKVVGGMTGICYKNTGRGKYIAYENDMIIGKLENMLELQKFEARKIRERGIEPYCRNKLEGEKRLKDGLYKMWRERAEWKYDNYQINIEKLEHKYDLWKNEPENKCWV